MDELSEDVALDVFGLFSSGSKGSSLAVQYRGRNTEPYHNQPLCICQAVVASVQPRPCTCLVVALQQFGHCRWWFILLLV